MIWKYFHDFPKSRETGHVNKIKLVYQSVCMWGHGSLMGSK